MTDMRNGLAEARYLSKAALGAADADRGASVVLIAVVREFAAETGLDIEVAGACTVDADVGPDPGTGRVRHTDRIVYQVVIRGGRLRPESAGGTDLAEFLDEPRLAAATVLPWCARGVSPRCDAVGRPL